MTIAGIIQRLTLPLAGMPTTGCVWSMFSAGMFHKVMEPMFENNYGVRVYLDDLLVWYLV